MFQRLCIKSSAKSNLQAVFSPDAYEFNESDDFINSVASHKSYSSSSKGHHRKKNERKTSGLKYNLKGNTKETHHILSKVTGKRLCKKNVSSKQGRKQKPTQTSTPVALVPVACKETTKFHLPERRRSPRIPLGMLDLSVTPILHISSTNSPFQPPIGCDPQNDSYIKSQNHSQKPLVSVRVSHSSQKRDHPQQLSDLAHTPVLEIQSERNLKKKMLGHSQVHSITSKCEEGVPVKKTKQNKLVRSVKTDPQKRKVSVNAVSSLSHQKCKTKTHKDCKKKLSASSKPLQAKNAVSLKLSKAKKPKPSTVSIAKVPCDSMDVDLFTMWDIGQENMCGEPLAVDSGISSMNSTSPSESPMADIADRATPLKLSPKPVMTETKGLFCIVCFALKMF